MTDWMNLPKLDRELVTYSLYRGYRFYLKEENTTSDAGFFEVANLQRDVQLAFLAAMAKLGHPIPGTTSGYWCDPLHADQHKDLVYVCLEVQFFGWAERYSKMMGALPARSARCLEVMRVIARATKELGFPTIRMDDFILGIDPKSPIVRNQKVPMWGGLDNGPDNVLSDARADFQNDSTASVIDTLRKERDAALAQVEALKMAPMTIGVRD